MIGIAIAAALSTEPIDPLTRRIADSAAAAQALQGALDGTWILHIGSQEGPLYRLQITEPPDAAGVLVGAWIGPNGATGFVELTRRGSHQIDIVMDTAPELRLTLRSRGRGWTGTLPNGATVVLTRRLATP